MPVDKEAQNEKSFIATLSLRALGCNPKGNVNPGDKKKLCRIFGKATGLKNGEDKRNGNVWTALQGQFEGINLETGATMRSGKLFLPNGIQDVIESEIKRLETNKDADGVVFGMEIYSVHATNPIGYSYEARNIMKVSAVDDLEALREQIEEKSPLKLLAAADKKK